MSEKLLKLLLSELKTFRIICTKCKTAIELDASNLVSSGKAFACPGCDMILPRVGSNDQTNPLQELARAMAVVNKCSTIEVQFVVPDTQS